MMNTQKSRFPFRPSDVSQHVRLGRVGVCAVISMLILAACALPPAPPPRRPDAAPSAPTGALAGTNWMLTTLDGNPPLANTTVTLNFSADGNAGGNDGCNAFGGKYTVDGGKLTFGPLIGTLIACEEPIMNQADAFRKALEQTAQFEVAGDTLTLSSADGKALATLARQSTDVAGTVWAVTNFNNGQQAVVGVQSGTSLTVRFDADGRVSGSAGCNTFTGPFKQDGAAVQIGPLATTLKACAQPDGVMDQEVQFLAALQSATTIQLDGDRLTLRTAEDATAVMMQRAP